MGQLHILTYFLDVLQLRNTNMRRNTPENKIISYPSKTSISNINICNRSHFIGAKIYVFFTSYVIIFNLTCT